jgi:cell division protein FtsB
VLTLGLVAAILIVLCSLVLASDGVPNLLALRHERQRLGEQAVALIQDNSALRDQIERLRSDDRFLEHLARRDLGLVGAGEVVYRFRRSPKGLTP